MTGIPFISGKPDPKSPDGIARSLAMITRPSDIQLKAERFIGAGGRYLCEQLHSGEAHLMAIIDVASTASLIAEETVRNGPPVLPAVDRLVRASCRHLDLEIVVEQAARN